MAKHGKNYRNAEAKIEASTLYTPKAALELVKELASAKFDETIDCSIRLGVDTRKADQNIRGSISLPHGTGKTVRVAVFAEGAKAAEAQAVDAAIATPNMMAKVGRIGKLLGPRGLMPNPKLGTVTMDVAKMVGELKAGRVEYRADRYGICHVPLGKASFELADLVDNYQTLIAEILRVKPATAKGRYIKSIAFSSTMGPGVKVDTTKVRALMED